METGTNKRYRTLITATLIIILTGCNYQLTLTKSIKMETIKWYTDTIYVDQATGEVISKWNADANYDEILRNVKIEKHEKHNLRKIYVYCERKRQLKLF